MDFLPVWPVEMNTLFFFGFLLFCGALGGFLAHRMSWLPSITGFMLVGLIAGPNVLGIFDHASLAQASIVIDIALALILYRLGLSLDFKALIHDKALLLVSLAESALTFGAVYFAMVFMGVDQLVAAVVAAIAISSSPAVLLHVSHELGAHGPTTSKAQALVALNNVWAFMVFAALMPALYSKSAAPVETMIWAPLYQLVGSTVLGMVLGWILHLVARLTKQATQYTLALVVGAVSMTLGLALTFGLSALFAPLVLGVVVRTAEKQNLIAKLEFGPAFELFFVALFVYAGANLHLHEMVAFAPAAAVYVIARSAAKWIGVTAIGSLVRWPKRRNMTAGLMLWPMAGMAIGLANNMTVQFPILGAEVASIVLAAVAVFETIGPPVVARALRLANEVGEGEDEQDWSKLHTGTGNKDESANHAG
ncbi:cation:proton antiporter [Hydrogenophaga sp. PAMC20947]|uniref:cation:proton antiporter n=1 Tax=Hydrogenophaga sp. PAMC20947 TaxID=2565558 RepID=UPI0014483742|nr:cation:proton antiporter [Hydrogenophaga sp. PAMC20947]